MSDNILKRFLNYYPKGVRHPLPRTGKYPPGYKKTNSDDDKYLLLIEALCYPRKVKDMILAAYFMDKDQLRKELDELDFESYHRPYEIDCGLWCREYQSRQRQCEEFGFMGILSFACDWYHYFNRDTKHLILLDGLIADGEKTKHEIAEQS